MPKTRRKITAHLPIGLLLQIEEVVSKRLGIGRNSFLALASGFLLIQLSRLQPRKSRMSLLSELEALLKETIADARRAA